MTPPKKVKPAVQLFIEMLSTLFDASAIKVDEGTIWHYTDAPGLMGILDSNTLWATSVRMLNDTSEIDHGREFVERAWENCRSEKSEVVQKAIDTLFSVVEQDVLRNGFVVCASRSGDLLSQWRGYSRPDTVPMAVGFSAAEEWTVVAKDRDGNAVDYLSRANKERAWLPVRYQQADKLKACHDLFHLVEMWIENVSTRALIEDLDMADSIGRAFTGYLSSLVASFKDEGFKDEREVRMFVITDLFASMPKAVHHREGTYGITPYVKLTQGSSTKTATAATKLKLERITVGPCRYPEAAMHGLISLLKHDHRLGEIVLDQTSIPYRSR